MELFFMGTKPLPTSTKIANLEKIRLQRIAKIEEKLDAQLSSLLTKRKNEIFTIFNDYSATNIDDKLLIGFLKFIANDENKNHPIINEFIQLATKPNVKKNTKSKS